MTIVNDLTVVVSSSQSSAYLLSFFPYGGATYTPFFFGKDSIVLNCNILVTDRSGHELKVTCRQTVSIYISVYE